MTPAPPPPGVTHVVTGFGGILTPLDTVLPAGSVLILDQPDMITSLGLPDKVGDHPCLAGLVSAPVQREDDSAALLDAVARPPGLRAVIPANEYGVVAAATLAEAWGVPGAGVAAARAFRDKGRLRTVAGRHGIAQPAWMLAADPDAIADFRARMGGECVVKPTNRQASLGVSLLGPHDSVQQAWRHAVQVDESAMRSSQMPAPRLLVEQLLHGPEVSVEALVSAGQVVFENVTAKTVQAGAYPVELGQALPAELPADVLRALTDAVRRLVRATGYGSGVLHSEWILVESTCPQLVECAARMPGDSIKDMIDLAYGGDLIADYVRVLEGTDPRRPVDARFGAAIRFLTAAPGVVEAVTGADDVAATEGVQEVHVVAEVGQCLDRVSCSWDRPGHVLVIAADGPRAAALAQQLADRIHIVTR